MLAPPIGVARAALHQSAGLAALLVVILGDTSAFVDFAALWCYLLGFGGCCWLGVGKIEIVWTEWNNGCFHCAPF